MSIRLRLTLWYSGLLAVTLVAFGVVIYGIVQNNTMSSLKDQLRRISEETQVRGRVGQGVNLSGVLRSAIDYNSFFIQIVNYIPTITGVVDDKTPNMRSSTNRPELTFTFPKQNEVRHGEYAFVKREIEGIPFLVLENPIMYNDEVVGLLQVGAWTGREEQLLHQLRSILWFAGAAGLIAAFLLGMFLSRKALMPINRVTEAAERIQSGSELSLRIPREKPNDEIGRLTDTLNAMLSGVERAYKNLEDSNAAQRRFVSDASHELRTPLTTIRGNVDLLEKIWVGGEAEPRVDTENVASTTLVLTEEEKRGMSLESIRDIADEARRMSGLVNHLLSLARADAGYVMEMGDVELLPLAEEAARRAAFLPRKAEWAVGPLDLLSEVKVRGNRDYLLQLLFILIENGFKYTPSGVVRLYAARRDNAIGLSVADTGIGIALEEVPHIFERFYRVDVSRGETSGTGLGLSIAKWIADMHHARIEVQTRLGEGTVFTLWLPVQREEKPA
ncbi:HAMP domain-containing histidine kinase [Cohnella sp. LGH]|uniref:sensor histidine kinase n=1 Tax=Cohnella sp. LGH TaxID=1619153 RepID=UPI001ADCB54A|nr:HAMP domain-containing sensor histidine kinase [Cohnella sp. LGH]QTH44294.1 HAMP domain-containing histidine kinase [Cohnella sp. LGH]